MKSSIAKAIVASLVSGFTTAAPLAADGLNLADAMWIGLAFFSAFGATWLVPNVTDS